MTEPAVQRLALFAGNYWGWPYDGGTDYRGTFDTVDAAFASLPAPHEVESGWGCAYAQVLDLVTGEQVAWRRATYAPPGESVWSNDET